jgi:hypothetical protein
LADDTPAPTPDKSAFSLFNPVPDDAQRGLSTDRPTKSLSPITVDVGHILIESDRGNHSFGTYAGVTSSTPRALDPVIKRGVTNAVKRDMALGGLESFRETTAATHALIGRVEGGPRVPVTFTLRQDCSLTLEGDVDLLAGTMNASLYPAFQIEASLSTPFPRSTS